MSTLTRILTLALILSASAVRGGGRRSTGTGTSAGTGETMGLARQTGCLGLRLSDQGRPSEAASGGSTPARSGLRAPADPYGFAAVLNRIRASMGLRPVAYDPSLSSWASQNNVAQSNRGLGHHVNPNCYQNCGWNYADAESVAMGWMNSPGHRQNMLQPDMSRFGIAFGPGPYWTMNAM